MKMTEAEWVKCRDPDELLDYHSMKREQRRLRLLAVACARRMWLSVGEHLQDEVFTQLLDVVERYADGTADRAEFIAIRKPFRKAVRDRSGKQKECLEVAMSVLDCLTHDAMEGMTAAVANAREVARSKAREGGAQCELIRCIFGHPARPIVLDPAWLTHNDGAAVKLARVIYDGRRWEELPLLADALEEAGCADPTILDHLRGPGLHARGCRTLDAVLTS
jgi:hypothetical protein